jgi:hypothetical protein
MPACSRARRHSPDSRRTRLGQPFTALALTLAALLLPGCAGTGGTSEAQWQRGQCAQIVDRDAREKCIKRVEDIYGKR